MLLEVATTHNPATDLGYLLHKHPDRSQSFDLSFGRAHVFYPEATPKRCAAAMVLDVNPVGLVQKSRRFGAHDQSLPDSVSDPRYVAPAFVSVAVAAVDGC